MKLVFVAVLIIASADLASAQTDQSPCRDYRVYRQPVSNVPLVSTPQHFTAAVPPSETVGIRADVIVSARQVIGIVFTADCIEPRPEGALRVQGNVTITVREVVITADEAVIDKGEITLGPNARVRVVPKEDPPR